MELRVNYSLLDSEGVFVKILLNQLETAEGHLWKDAKNVIPDIFFFLVLLSNEHKSRSNYVVHRNDIINLCSTLAASGLSLNSHAIPALTPVVHDSFCLSNTNQEINSSREVLLNMLLNMSSICGSFPLLGLCSSLPLDKINSIGKVDDLRLFFHQTINLIYRESMNYFFL